jgi:2-C-methyl-D-erythritol 4-phosphate cytidylyltransferase
MFRAGLLAEALARSVTVTDEASAIEALGLQPKLVASDSSNFKVTYPQDIELAELLLNKKM